MKTLWIALLLAGTTAWAAPTVAISAKVNGVQMPTGGTVASGAVVAYTVTVANPDTPRALSVVATCVYDDAGVSQTVTATATVNVVSVVRPVITLVVPPTLALTVPSILASGDWPGQVATYDSSSSKLTWTSPSGDLMGGKVAYLGFSGTAR